MPDNIVYLITGTNRGLGLAMVAHLIQRPNTTVIASYRTQSSPDSSPFVDILTDRHPTSKLIPLPLSSPISSTDSFLALLPDGSEITHLDVLIANAGGTRSFASVSDTTADDLRHDFEVNAVAPAELFRACWPLLEKRSGLKGAGKFVLVSSSVGSIGCLEEESFPTTAYGMSKAAANWWARKVSLEFRDRGLIVGVLHPGWVKTGMGQGLADAIGAKGGPTMTAKESAEKVVEQIDKLTLETSGQFITYSGQRLPW